VTTATGEGGGVEGGGAEGGAEVDIGGMCDRVIKHQRRQQRKRRQRRASTALHTDPDPGVYGSYEYGGGFGGGMNAETKG